jgi:signal peptidase II
MKFYKYFGLSLAVIALDQVIKLLVHFSMEMGPMGEIHLLGDWLKIHYILNPGMAFGLKLDFAVYGKLMLSLFRILATCGIAYYITVLVKQKAHSGLIWCIALILGGALGNVIDSTFYGLFIPSNLPYDAPMAIFHGQVIDMIYVDIWEGELPSWIPFLGGKSYSFWPIFNIADASIFVGVSIILIRQRAFFKPTTENKEEDNVSENENHNTSEVG